MGFRKMITLMKKDSFLKTPSKNKSQELLKMLIKKKESDSVISSDIDGEST
jgi:hypothetical protein